MNYSICFTFDRKKYYFGNYVSISDIQSMLISNDYILLREDYRYVGHGKYHNPDFPNIIFEIVIGGVTNKVKGHRTLNDFVRSVVSLKKTVSITR